MGAVDDAPGREAVSRIGTTVIAGSCGARREADNVDCVLNGVVALNLKLIRRTVTILTLGLAASAWAGEVSGDRPALLRPLYPPAAPTPGTRARNVTGSISAGGRRPRSYSSGPTMARSMQSRAWAWSTSRTTRWGSGNKTRSARSRSRWAHTGAGSNRSS